MPAQVIALDEFPEFRYRRRADPPPACNNDIIMPCIVVFMSLLYLIIFRHDLYSIGMVDLPTSQVFVAAQEHIAVTRSLLREVHTFVTPGLYHASRA